MNELLGLIREIAWGRRRSSSIGMPGVRERSTAATFRCSILRSLLPLPLIEGLQSMTCVLSQGRNIQREPDSQNPVSKRAHRGLQIQS